MRTTGVLRLLVLAATALTAYAQEEAVMQDRHLAVANAAGAAGLVSQAAVHESHVARVLHKKAAAPAPAAEEEEEEEEAEEAETPAPSKKKHKKAAAETTAPAPAATTAAPPAPTTAAPAPTTAAPPAPTPAPAPAPTTAAPTAAAETPAPSKKHKKKKKAAEAEEESAPEATPSAAPAPAATTAAPAPEPTKKVNDKRTKGYNNTGIIDGSSEGSSEIDKIDLRNQDSWVSVYNDPPLLVIKASLYAFISYNDSRVCDSFNMTLNAVEQKPDGNGTFSYHVVTYINCTKDSVDETPGRFVLNFIPEGKRLLLTECGHREDNEIVNWLKIKEEVPECMTPHERKSFLAQPMKHIHASNGTTDAAPKQTDFFTRLEELDGREVAIAGSATVALIAVIVVIAVFIVRKRKAQKDLERTIAGAKAEHADDEEDKDKDDDDEKDEKKDKKEKKGDEEGSFVNSPAVKV